MFDSIKAAREHYKEVNRAFVIGYCAVVLFGLALTLFGALTANEWLKYYLIVGPGICAVTLISMISPTVGSIVWIGFSIYFLFFFDFPVDPAIEEIRQRDPEYGNTVTGMLVTFVFFAGPAFTLYWCRLRAEEERVIHAIIRRRAKARRSMVKFVA